MVYKTYNIF